MPSSSAPPFKITPDDKYMHELSFKDLIQFEELQNMLEVSYTATGMPAGIIDAFSGEFCAGAGWQKICSNFHRVHPKTSARCLASDTAITNKIKQGEHFGYKCSNGLWDIGVPIHCMGTHMSTLFLGQFFYVNEEPDIKFFRNQADQYGFDKKKYLEALAEVPRFTHEKVDEILKYNIALAAFLSDLASSIMKNKSEIEQRKLAEKKFRNLQTYLSNIIDSMPSALIGVSPDGKITQWNKNAEKISKIPAGQAIGMDLRKALPRLSSKMDQIKLAITCREKQFESAKPYIHNNKTRYEDLTIYPLIEDGVNGAVIRIDDVTERINMEKMMIQSEKMLSIGGLAAGMAHELNNPLAGMTVYANNIKKRLFEDLEKNIEAANECNISLTDFRKYLNQREIAHMLDGILGAGRRAASIINNVLNFSRKSEIKLRQHKITAILDNTLELIANDYSLTKEYDFKRIELVREYDHNIPEVYCEKNEIQQVFLNILKNGAETMAEKEYSDNNPRFICKISKQDKMVVVEIEDNGKGMDKITKARIFEPFYTTKGIGEGTGLGLSVSYFIITNQHSGFMGVQSELNSWTKFIIKLPIKGKKTD
ncbi:PocR ligand-binding domain-containing protein [Maridesulfovibrio frigidus]|uniref:PocR ligand-binding domain-containing protein n=1 Tax=Maridesulfovibrio frigidus TaxID=340956 RepID=UPI00068AA419|nr:PocR ligand-binding domain-containing protein [Maridesulfovibrio frigidus]